jgi:hypothetical protein
LQNAPALTLAGATIASAAPESKLGCAEMKSADLTARALYSTLKF